MNEIFERALEVVKTNRQRRLEGGYNSIPFTIDKLNKVIPGVQRKNMTIISAASGVGKSKLAKLLYVIEPINFIFEHPDVDMKLNIFYFALEESKENFYHSIMVYKLYKDHNLIVPIKKLKSIILDEIIDEDVINKIEGMRDWFNVFKKHVKVIDDIRKPTTIFKTVEEYLLSVGHWITKDKVFHFKDGDKVVQIKDKFVYDSEQHYVGVIIDHLALLSNESGLNIHQTMSRMSSDYGIALRDKYECFVTFIQQQAFETESKQYTMKGGLVEEKLEPTMQTLGDNKLVARDADEIIALFAPNRYDIANHRGYQVLKMQDNYRSLQILKSRDGMSNVRIGLYFDGRNNIFEELPLAKEMTDEDYEYYANRAGRTTTSNIKTNKF
jgi:replicative DNA helicase